MPPRKSIELNHDDLLVFFEKNNEFNRELRRLTQATDIRFDWDARAYRLSAAAARSPEVCHNLREFAIRHNLGFGRAAARRLGAFVTRNSLSRLRAELSAIEEKLRGGISLPNFHADGGTDMAGRLAQRAGQLRAMLSWPAFGVRPAECDLVSPGCLIRVGFADGEEQTVIISAVDLPDYDRFSPFKSAGRAAAVSRVGQGWQLENGRGTVRILAIMD
ncbi:hypothetical protein [Streptosporangium sandarakinum]|uniref:Uncharacterized protein n=1 Tax=Streptosporangium sandarakinum TaxID=1260955 RepID=A0A852V6M3_9ACTN|nr:hypothetical protein [Streptosporangium sandarakinum]NYF42943.1 hypothetical protein [Streptosporangium sandarakinum]